jgi:hypothetical protein
MVEVRDPIAVYNKSKLRIEECLDFENTTLEKYSG